MMTMLCPSRTSLLNYFKIRHNLFLWTQTLRKFCDQRTAVSGDKTGDNEEVKVIYVSKDGQKTEVKGRVGDNAMYLAHSNDIEIEGACEASLACCTCHVYVDQRFAGKLSEATEEEEDLLDMAPFLKPNSRLSCQIVLSKELDGIVLTLPAATRNFYVDGKKPTPH